jgi:hypothetical protein
MRVVLFVVVMLTMATTSEASRSCMSKTEARRHFGPVHLYWHGADHCWDASSSNSSRQTVHNVARKIDPPKMDQPGRQDSNRQASNREASAHQDSARQDSAGQDSAPQDAKPQDSRWRVSGWQDSMSKMLADDEAVQTPVQRSWTDRWVDIKPTQPPLAARWVDIAPVAPPLSKSTPDPELRMMMLVLVLIVFTLALTIIQVRFRAVRAAEGDRIVA